MAIRREWTEWHLTPRGWEMGSTRVHGAGNTWRDEPGDRLLSFVYKEQQSDAQAQPATSSEETWRTKDPGQQQLIEEHLARYGKCPERLV